MSLVDSFTHLKGRPHEDKALPTLQRIASLVKPIMRKHSWTLPVLAEFFPQNDSLVGMNVNKGQKILLRLRPPHAPDTFYDDEQLALVMLHELTHNVHGPHDTKFYALLASLEKEYEDLRRSGYAGEGFHSTGVRVGAGISHDLPPHLAKQRALAAAEKRRIAASAMGGSGRLGGRAVRGKTPRELAAEAAERRVRDEKSCASGHGVEAEIEAQRAARDSVINVIDVDALESPPQSNRSPSPEVVVIEGPRENTGETPEKKRIVAQPKKAVVSSSGPRLSAPSRPPAALISDEWVCAVCTLFNAPLALQCAACYTSRPTAGWTCFACGEPGMPHDFWTCRACGRVKNES